MNILSIDTSCDETSVAVTSGRRILANVVYSQILIHKDWGGVVPHLAKRAHEERIDTVVEEALKKVRTTGPVTTSSQIMLPAPASARVLGRPPVAPPAHLLEKKMKMIDYIAVTYGPGLAPALQVGMEKAKELAKMYNKKIIPVNHMEGHIYSCFAQNSVGNPNFNFEFPYIALLVSGGHTEIVLFKNHDEYEILGETLDDAAGEALDKAAKMLGLGYPGGPVIEQLARQGNSEYHKFPRPILYADNVDFSFSGLKTSFFYFLKTLTEDEKIKLIPDLAASYQDAVFTTLIYKLEKAIKKTGVGRIIAAGGVIANSDLRRRLRALAKKNKGTVLFPTFKTLYGDNAAMIGIAANYKKDKALTIDTDTLFIRVPRARLGEELIWKVARQ